MGLLSVVARISATTVLVPIWFQVLVELVTVKMAPSGRLLFRNHNGDFLEPAGPIGQIWQAALWYRCPDSIRLQPVESVPTGTPVRPMLGSWNSVAPNAPGCPFLRLIQCIVQTTR